jgi:hypothetical protein
MKTLAAVLVAAALLGSEDAAAASTMKVYGGDPADGIPVSLQLRARGDDIAPLGRITLTAFASCPDKYGDFVLTVNQPIVTPYDIPSGDVLLGRRRSGGRFVAEGGSR